MESKSYNQNRKVAALLMLLAFLSTGIAALPVVAAPCPPVTVNAAVNSTVNASVTITPECVQVGGTVNVAITLDGGGYAAYLKAVVTQPDGTQHFAWYNFTTTPGTLSQVFPSGTHTVESDGQVSAFFPAATTSEIGEYTVTILVYNMTTGESHPIATTQFYVENGIKVLVTTNAPTQANAAPRGGTIAINAAAYYIANGAPVNSAKAVATAVLSSAVNPSQSYSVTLTKTAAGLFTGTFTVPYNAYSGAWEVVAQVSDGMGSVGSNSTTAYVKPITLSVSAQVNESSVERTKTIQITATATGAMGKPITGSNGTLTATLYSVVNSAANAATNIVIPMTYSSSTSNWMATWTVPYNYPTGTYFFNVTAADNLVQPDTGFGTTGDFTVNPASIKIALSASPT
ncbi:MAG: hypothetical protein RXR41_01180, partial [Candidatus Marsarchaeota archaeon]